MNELIETKMDHKNIGLLKTLYHLRQDLDVYCLVSVNAKKINQKNVWKSFFGHIQQLSMASIVLSICKIFENEKRNELNSISGVLRHVVNEVSLALDHTKLSKFIKKYNGPSDDKDTISALSSTVAGFVNRYSKELEAFKMSRDKMLVHSEYGFKPSDLPSFDVMEKLFDFGLAFYSLVSDAFIGVGSYDLNDVRRVKGSLKTIFNELGLEEIKTEFE